MHFVLLGVTLNNLFIPRRRLSHSPKRIARDEGELKRAEVIAVWKADYGDLLLILARFFKLSRKEFSRKLLAKSE